MAKLYISEYAELGTIHGEKFPVATEPPLAEQTVSIGGSSTQSNAFSSQTKYIRVHTDAICSVLVGANPEATASKKRLSADQTEYFAVAGGDKIAVITNS